MATSGSRSFVRAASIGVALNLVLLAISPGVGSQLRSVGLGDAWRAQLGLSIAPAELLNRPGGDANQDGRISDEEFHHYNEFARMVGFSLRLPRSLLALQVGATLGICGAAFQVLFRNSLATPYSLGVVSGGSLGAVLAIRLGWVAVYGGVSSLSMAAFLGGVAVEGLGMVLSFGRRKLAANELLLAGVTLGLFCSALMMLVTVISDEQQTFEMVRWSMGSLDAVRTVEGARLLPLLLPCWVVLVALAPAFNQYRVGDEAARSRGVNVVVLQTITVGVCTLGVAGVVAQCGPIGFVGLVVPHIVRKLVGSDCRMLFPMSALGGGAFLILCDWGAQLAMRVGGLLTGQQLGGATLPVGVVTALVGVPVFLILLRARPGR